MKKKLFISLLLIVISFTQMVFAQTKEIRKIDPNSFDEKGAYEIAKAKGIKSSELKGYVQFLKNDFSSKKALAKQPHKHSPYELGSTGIQETVIYLEPNKPMSLGCPNMGFEQYNFNGWTGGTGTVSIGTSGTPTYNSIGSSIINAAGNNVSVLNTANYQTIMTLPAINPVYPTCNGYDSLACRAVGSQTISQIPLVSPFSFDPVSVRMNGSLANYRACRLKYITTSSSTNQRLSFSYAVILQDPTSSPHTAAESPYFKVEVKNETTGTILPGCTSYTFNPKTTLASDSLLLSAIDNGVDPTYYRKWQYYSVDLSSLPVGTNVSINFEVGGCTNSGHWGYAYVDAECGGIGTPYANMCSGTNFATLVAPTGFTTYQWYDPSGILIPGPGGTNDTLIQSPATPGTTYSVNMVSPGGCAISQTVTIGFTTVNIINLNSTSSCAGGNSGTASVLANGSNGIYTYSWTNTTAGLNFGQTVGTSQIATGLSPGTYSVLVSSTTCGQASANLSVGVSPPFFYSQAKSFCGNSTAIAQSGGSSYSWYHNSALIPSPIGTNDTLYISNAVAGDLYTVVYNNAQGCRDSIVYTLNQIAGGNSYFSNTSNVCPSFVNGSTVLNLNTPFPAPYNYLVTGPSAGVTVINTTTSVDSIILSPLAPGTYTAIINDGVCIYNNTVTVGTIQTNFTVTPTSTVLCFPDPVTMNLDFGAGAPTSCGIDPVLCSGSSPTTLFAAGTFTQNGTTDYPTPFGNWWTYGRTQFLVRKAELNAAGIVAGRISSLAFNLLSLNTSTLNYPNYSIKMGCTSLSALPNASSSSSQPFITGLQTVYTNANQSVSLGWLTHNFTQSYLWDGNSNIIIEICFGQNSPSTFSQNVSVQLKQVPYIANMYHVEDTAPVCGGSQQADNGISAPMTNGQNMLPNMKFGYCPYAPPAANYTVAVSSNGTITANYANDSIRVTPTFATPTGPVIYTISVTNPIGGCIATQTVEVVYPPIITSITAIPTSTTLCEGSNTILSATGAYNYNWFYLQSGVPIAIATTSSINVTPPTIGANTYIVTGYESCASSIPDTKTITVNVTPITNLIVTPLQDVTKCLNKSFTYNTGVGSTIPSNQGTPYTYLWTTLPGNIPAPGTNTDSNYVVNSNTTTTLVVTVSGKCANSTSDTVVVKNFIDDLAITIIDSSTTCANTAFTLHSVTSGGKPTYYYDWTMSPNATTLSNTSILTATSPADEGNYTVTVYVNDSCGYNRSAIEVIKVLPPCSVIIPNVITPNGDNANDFFIIKNIEYHPNTSVTIFDRWGRKVYENPNYNNEWKAEGVSDGTFFYVIEVPDDKKYNGFITVFKGK